MDTQTSQSLPLWRQLQEAAQVLQVVQAGHSTTVALENTPLAWRPGVQALVFEALRNWGRAQALCHLLAQRVPAAPVRTLLCLALSLAWREDTVQYEPYTLVNQAVEAAKHSRSTRMQAAFINACLRRFLRQRPDWVAQTEQMPQARWNHPLWWIKRVQRDHPVHWQTILQAGHTKASMILRINRRKTTQELYLKELAAINMSAFAVAKNGISLAQPCGVTQLPGFAQGWVSVQDAAAQQAAPLLLQALRMPNPRILDACAAPGGKTAHLLELADCQVTALDIDAQRCEKIKSNLQRLGLHAHIQVADATQVHASWASQSYDAILLDAPCTASGIVRRHPDIPWLRRASDVDSLAATQARLLQTLWPLLRLGGFLLYATCSVFRSEGDEQIQAFLARHSDATLCPSPGHLLVQSPDNPDGEQDGFYYALLQKH